MINRELLLQNLNNMVLNVNKNYFQCNLPKKKYLETKNIELCYCRLIAISAKLLNINHHTINNGNNNNNSNKNGRNDNYQFMDETKLQNDMNHNRNHNNNHKKIKNTNNQQKNIRCKNKTNQFCKKYIYISLCVCVLCI